MIRPRLVTLAIAVSLATATMAHAKTYSVKKGGNLDTIQAGVDAAKAGDVVVVHPGLYLETVTIPFAKEGLTMRSKTPGKAVLDARGPAGAGRGPALRIQAADVTLDGFVVQNAAVSPTNVDGIGIYVTTPGVRIKRCVSRGHVSIALLAINATGLRVEQSTFSDGLSDGIAVAGDDVKLTKVTVRNVAGVGISISGDGAKVTQCTVATTASLAVQLDGDDGVIAKTDVLGSYGPGIQVTGDFVTVVKSRVLGAKAEGLHVTGSSARLTDNRIEDIEADGVVVIGDATTADGNRIEGVDGFGLSLDGAGVVAEKNLIVGTTSYGLDVDGASAVVCDNTVERTNGYNINVSGADPTVTGNDCRFALDEYSGISCGGGASSGLIRNNRVTDASDYGITLSTQSANFVIEKNQVDRCGNYQEAGFRIRGAGHVLRKNDADDCSGDGFYVMADGVTLDDNRARGNGRDGIDVDGGSGNTVRKNLASGNGAEGIENNGSSTDVHGNVMKRNRIDFANDGTLSTFHSNAVADGSGAATSPEID